MRIQATFSASLVSSDKLKEVRSLMSFIQEKIIHGLGECRASEAVEHSFREIWGKSVLQRSEEAMQKQGVSG